MPERLQRRRTRGWRLPEGAVYVGRPTKWGNPYRPRHRYWWADGVAAPYPTPEPLWSARSGERLVRCTTVEQAVAWYRTWITEMVPALAEDARTELAGRDLACWCPLSQPCHADVLLEITTGGGRHG